jgi:hypothetical protein
MWICLNNAFISAVAIKGNPGHLKVRARKREHLERLFPGYEIAVNKGTDYKYRTVVGKRYLADLVAAKIKDIDYDNFKNSVKDDGLHNLYAGFWEDHYDYQSSKKL